MIRTNWMIYGFFGVYKNNRGKISSAKMYTDEISTINQLDSALVQLIQVEIHKLKHIHKYIDRIVYFQCDLRHMIRYFSIFVSDNASISWEIQYSFLVIVSCQCYIYLLFCVHVHIFCFRLIFIFYLVAFFFLVNDFFQLVQFRISVRFILV